MHPLETILIFVPRYWYMLKRSLLYWMHTKIYIFYLMFYFKVLHWLMPLELYFLCFYFKVPPPTGSWVIQYHHSFIFYWMDIFTLKFNLHPSLKSCIVTPVRFVIGCFYFTVSPPPGSWVIHCHNNYTFYFMFLLKVPPPPDSWVTHYHHSFNLLLNVFTLESHSMQLSSFTLWLCLIYSRLHLALDSCITTVFSFFNSRFYFKFPPQPALELYIGQPSSWVIHCHHFYIFALFSLF